MNSPAGRLPAPLRFPRALLAVVCLVATLPCPAGTTVAQPALATCDRPQDRLSLHADQVPLRTLLGVVAAQCGIAISLDPAADTAISVHVDKLPIEVALERATGRLNVIRQYRVSNGKRQLAALVILPAGVADTGRALPVAAPAIAKKQAGPGKRSKGKDVAQEIARITERAEKRIATLPVAERAKARERLERRIEKLRKREIMKKNEGARNN